MTSERPSPPHAVPTLTEEVSLPPPPAPAAARSPGVEPTTAPAAASIGEAELTQRILADVQRQVDQVLEYRLREVLTPVLNRATDALVRDARAELSRSLHDVVARSVAQEMLRQRSR